MSSQVNSPPIPSSIWQLSFTLNNNTVFNETFFNNVVFEIQTKNISKVLCQACQGDNCFYLDEVLVTHDRASVVCKVLGGQLANINNSNELNATRSVYDDTFWINGFQNNSTTGCLVLIGNNSTTADCNTLHLALCEFPKSPAFGC